MRWCLVPAVPVMSSLYKPSLMKTVTCSPSLINLHLQFVRMTLTSEATVEPLFLHAYCRGTESVVT